MTIMFPGWFAEGGRSLCNGGPTEGLRGRGEDAVFFEVSSPAVYLINLYEIFLPKN